MKATAYQNRYHPIRDFLAGVVWDGTDWIARLERYVKDAHPQIVYANGDRLPVFGAWLKRWGVAAVGKVLSSGAVRIQNPMLVFAGPQDAGKSTLARFLCPLPDRYYIESTINPESNDHNRYLAIKFIWEVGELGATTRKADREALKEFLTKQDTTFRVPYEPHPITKPALTSFIGTVNIDVGFLNDPTGHRRFLPVEIKKIDFDYIHAIDPAQLWAQFVALYRAGEPVRLLPEEKRVADAIRAGHEIEDPYAGFVAKFYDIDLSKAKVDGANQNWSAPTTDIVEQLSINGVQNPNTTNVGIALARLGLAKGRGREGGILVTRWYGLSRNNTGYKVRP
jgi:predicted P-loop ATPase